MRCSQQIYYLNEWGKALFQLRIQIVGFRVFLGILGKIFLQTIVNEYILTHNNLSKSNKNYG